jgi:hypothetical protein
MTRHFGLVVAVVAAFLMMGPSTAQAAKGVKNGAEHQVHGKVLAVHQGKHGVHLTIKVHHHGKAGTMHAQGHRTFQITRHTQIQGKLHKGAHVVVSAKGHHADKIAVVPHKGKPKKP